MWYDNTDIYSLTHNNDAEHISNIQKHSSLHLSQNSPLQTVCVFVLQNKQKPNGTCTLWLFVYLRVFLWRRRHHRRRWYSMLVCIMCATGVHHNTVVVVVDIIIIITWALFLVFPLNYMVVLSSRVSTIFYHSRPQVIIIIIANPGFPEMGICLAK